MPRKRIENAAVAKDPAGAQGDPRKDAHRRRNRAYMRRWRADAGRRNDERKRRVAWYRERKAREGEVQQGPVGDERPKAICMICRLRPAVKEIVRLRVSESAASGFEELLIPYCGEC